MYKTFQYILTPLMFLFSVSLMYSQERDTIQTDVINVVKPYTPTISDAFKVKTAPVSDEVTTVKKTVDYNILSIPVASTFIPTKGKAAVVEREKPELFYENYFTLGYGSYGNLISDLYLTKEFDRISAFGARITYDKSNGGIEDKVLDNSFANTNIELQFIKRQRNQIWNIKAGFEGQKYNWYGLESPYETAANKTKAVDHKYSDIYAIGDVVINNMYLKSASLTLRHFSDKFDSGEGQLKFTGKVNLPIIIDEEIKTNVRLEYLSGSAGENYVTSIEPIEYGNLLLGVSPTYQLGKDNLNINIGASAYFMVGFYGTESNLYLYPNITGTFNVVEDVLVAYGGLTGDVIQNTYRDFVNSNPFLSPTINVKPTDNSINAYAGMLGKITNKIGYNVKAGYTSENDKALFLKNSFPSSGNTMSSNSSVYKYGNSFTVVYDNIKTIQALFEINMEMNENFKMGLRTEYMNYSTSLEEEAWNLPNIKASIFGNYMSDNNWFAGAKIFYVGERMDQNVLTDGNITTTNTTISLDGYLDLNLDAGYNLSNRFTMFLKLNNIVGGNYERWSNYNVQGFQILAGATYKFDL